MKRQIEAVITALDPQASAYFKSIIPEYQNGYIDYIYQSDKADIQKRRLKYISKLFQIWQDNPWFYIMPMTQESAEIIAKDWLYPAPYDFYNLAADPEDYAEMIDPKLRQNSYFQVIRNGILFGFASFEINDKELEIGLGMAPKWTGQSHGKDFLRTIEDYTKANYSCDTLVLNVAAFNSRAISLYTNSGYKKIETFKQTTNGADFDFIRMEKKLNITS
ncbi:GNAT family N-acetyltransferase [Streptococcus parauberis]|uniref:GNAT family N-acetyltransferase n=1 Tax=Streptococcus parauberis TaxID=1348 RepID=UPI0037AFEE4D